MRFNRILFTLFGAVSVIGTLSLSSCSDFDPMDDEDRAAMNLQSTLNEFTRNFEARYGTVDMDNDFGFGPVVVQSTRGEVINKNQWIDVYHLQVPGWPDTYYTKDGGETIYSNGYHDKDDNYTADINTTQEPGGDVTDEEIQYVSCWFRTHRYPTTLPVHWSDFYIQEVSSDNDRKADGTVDRDFTLFEYDQNTGAWVKKITNYDMTMDYLGVKTQDDPNNFIHLEKFNKDRQNKLHSVDQLSMDINNPYQENVTVNGETKTLSGLTNTRLIDFYTCMSTEDFMCHNSVDNTDRNNYKFEHKEEATPIWVLVHLHFIGPSGRIYDGYYLGFDFASFKNNGTSIEMREPDGYYSNWIVKISPAIPIVNNNPYTRRIMCEDLGNTFDLDFDDVVFDATVNQASSPVYDASGNADVTINLLASGGTMPIWVGKNPNNNLNADFETHKLMNNNTTTPINVGGVNAPVANYHATVSGTAGSAFDFDDIPIWVYNTKRCEWVELPKVKCLTHDVTEEGGTSYIYNKNKDERYAPQKFAVPASVLWLKETHQIEQGYPHFGEWAHDHNKYPLYTSNGDDNTTGAWYAVGVNSNHILGQAGMTPRSDAPTPGTYMDNGYPGTTSTFMSYKTWDVVPYVNNDAWGTAVVTNGTGGPSAKTFKAGESATLVATAKNGAVFKGWKEQESGDYLSTNTTYTIENIDRRHVIMAVFEGNPVYTLNLTADSPLTINIVSHTDKNGQTVTSELYGDHDKVKLSYSGTLPTGKGFAGWYKDGVFQNAENEYEVTLEQKLTSVQAKVGDLVSIPVEIKTYDTDGATIIDNVEGNKVKINDVYYSNGSSISSVTGRYIFQGFYIAEPTNDYTFVEWDNLEENTTQWPFGVLVTNTTKFVAKFKKNTTEAKRRR